MTNAEARFNNSLRPRKPEGSLGRTAQDGHLDSHTAPELWLLMLMLIAFIQRCSPLSSRSLRSQLISTWVNSFLSTEVVYLQRWHGWCYMKLLPFWRILRTPYNHAPRHFMQISHIRKVHACCNLPPALWAEWPGSFTCYCGNTGVERILKWVSTESWHRRRKFSSRSCRDSNLRPFNHESGAVTTERSPLPIDKKTVLTAW